MADRAIDDVGSLLTAADLDALDFGPDSFFALFGASHLPIAVRLHDLFRHGGLLCVGADHNNRFGTGPRKSRD